MTQTEEPTRDSAAATDAHHAAPQLDDHHDPTHDIDGKKTVFAVLGTLGLVVFLIWAMSHLFNVMVQVERKAKIGDTPAAEFHEVKAGAEAELAGKAPGKGSKSIDEAIEAYLKK